MLGSDRSAVGVERVVVVKQSQASTTASLEVVGNTVGQSETVVATVGDSVSALRLAANPGNCRALVGYIENGGKFRRAAYWECRQSQCQG